MPFLSSHRHCDRYRTPDSLPKQVAEIKILLSAIRLLPISEPLKKRMLVHAIWEVAFATGNTQRSFLGRYRSESVVRQVGLNIERDHIFRKETLIRELLGPSPDLDRIIERAHCCVVTRDEHERLSRVDEEVEGWERYRAAGITVYDMLDQTKMDLSAAR
jgi:hypothetical protein